jgi:hypothetical protein
MTTRKRRPVGGTRERITLDPHTTRRLTDLAAKTHGGDVSALITDLADAAARRAAFETAWRWYGGPEPTPDARAAIDSEMEEGWALARKHARKPRPHAADCARTASRSTRACSSRSSVDASARGTFSGAHTSEGPS